MTAVHIHDDKTPPPANATKDGTFYDRCPEDGCLEADPTYVLGGGEQFRDASVYFADPRKGGCGTNWSRTTRQGAERDRSRGVNPKWLTQGASLDRYTSLPSERYRRNYDCAFRRCGCALMTDEHRCGEGCH